MTELIRINPIRQPLLHDMALRTFESKTQCNCATFHSFRRCCSALLTQRLPRPALRLVPAKSVSWKIHRRIRKESLPIQINHGSPPSYCSAATAGGR